MALYDFVCLKDAATWAVVVEVRYYFGHFVCVNLGFYSCYQLVCSIVCVQKMVGLEVLF